MMNDNPDNKRPFRNYLVLLIGIYLLLSGILQFIFAIMKLSSPMLYFETSE